MAVTYGFFNSLNGDRKYNAEQMSDYFRGIVSEGVFQHLDSGLAVTAGTGLTVNVAAGRAIVQNRWMQNDASLELSISAASETYARIDAVVIRLDWSSRAISIAVKTGTPGASPAAPSLTRNSTTYEMALAYVNVAASATSVTVTDKRSDGTVCGWATVAQATSGEVDAQLNAMKTGFDGVTYSSPAAMVTSCDDLIHTNLSAELKTFEDGEHQLLNGGMFTGSINADGTIDTSIKYRAYTPLLQKFDRDITIRFASPVIGFFLAVYNSAGVIQSRTFYQEAHTITAGTYFKICSAAENTQAPDVLYKATYFDSLLGTVLDEQEWDEFTKYALMNGAVLFSGKYINGGVNSSGAVDSTMTYRVTTKDILYADKKIFFKISTGWQAFYSTYQQDGTFIERTQYTTPGIYAIPQGTYFRVTISQNPEVPGTADIKTDALNVFVVKQDSQNPVRKWVAIGDSLTEVNQTATSRYCDYITQNLNLTLVNMGVGGTGYKNGGSNENTFYARALTVPTDADVYTFFGSGNDGASTLNNAAIGDPDDTGTTTICGCMNTAFDNIYSVNPGAIIGVITPTPWAIWPPYGEENPSATIPRDNPAWMSDYADAMVAVCKRRGIPCLDLYHCSAMRPWDSTFQTLFYSKDGNNGVHPDENGHKYFITPHIQEFVKSLIQYPETT